MYDAHFGLREPPFRITPNTGFFFGGGSRGPILEALIYAITRGEGIVKVTGEVGSGKTMLCSMLQSRLPEHVETVYLGNPSVSADEILHAIAFELQLGIARKAGRLEVMHALQAYLLQRHAAGRRVVLFVEESQSMPIATLEEIRLLSNLETPSEKLLQIVLFGQPELDQNLGDRRIRQLRERITHSFSLQPLDEAETHEYLMFRLRTAGYRGPDLFSQAVVREIVRRSGGLTRRINLIADKALLAAFAENTHTLHRRHIAAALRDSEFARTPTQTPATGMTAAPIRLRGLLLLVAGLVTGLGISAWWQNRHPAGGPVSNPGPAPLTFPGTPATADRQFLQATADLAAQASAAMQPPGRSAAGSGSPPKPRAPDDGMQGLSPALRARVAATEEWLARSDPMTYTLQLLGPDYPSQLNQHISLISKIVEINDVFVYRSSVKGEFALALTWGSFGSRRAASEAMAGLPAALQRYTPMVRTVRGINTEIAANPTP